MAKNIRVGELAQELGLTKAEIIALCNAMGLNVRSATSTLKEAHADRLRRRAEQHGPAQSPGTPSNHAIAERVKSTWSTLVEAEADRLRRRAELEASSAPELPAVEPDVPNEVQGVLTVPIREYTNGDSIGGRFTVEELLGSGAFSKVYRVLDTVEGETRALKLFNNAAGYDAVRREINALRKVQHPNVVKVIWADKTDDGEWYLIMEFIDGELLADYSRGVKQMPDPEAVDVALDVLGALIAMHPDSGRLDELHRRKRVGELSMDEYDELTIMSETALVHRDVKPQNIMLTTSGAKLLDFNIASRVGDRVRTVTGTPPYQPPDADLTRWDVTTDLFALGVTLYELICHGEHPYPGARPMGGDDPRDPRQFRDDLPDHLAEFLTRACSPDRATRFDTAAEMKAALEAVRAAL